MVIEKKKIQSKWERILLWSMVVILIGGIVDLIQMAFALIALKELHARSMELISDQLFWDLLTNIRLQSILVAVAIGSLLIYYQLRNKNEG